MTTTPLGIIVGSTRPGRVGLPVARWIYQVATAHGGFDVRFIDLAAVGLPLLDEPNHPRMAQYQHQHTKEWSATIAPIEAFVIVNPEYNHGYNAAVKNAIDFLHNEWLGKPVAFVSYGGAAGGSRAAQGLKQVALALKMEPLYEGLVIASPGDYINDGVFHGTDVMLAGAGSMLTELAAAVHRRRVGPR